MPGLHSIARMAGYSYSAAVHNMKTIPLRSELPGTTQGKARNLTVENAIEIMCRFALHDANFDPHDAAQVAAQWLEDYRRGFIETAPYRPINLSRRQRTARIGVDEPKVGMPFGDPETPLKVIQEYAPDTNLDDFERSHGDGREGWEEGGALVAIIDLGKIVRRVKALEAQANG